MKKQLLFLFLSTLCSNTASIQANQQSQTIDVATIDLSACDADGNNAFHAAARAGDLATMKKLLDKQDEADGWYQSLSWCLWGSRAYPVNLQNNNGDTALHCAIENNHPEMVKLLLTQGKAKIDQKIANNKKSTPFWFAIEKRNEQVVTILIALDKKLLNEKDSNGNTPLLRAVIEKLASLTKILLQNGADTSIPSKRGLPALHESIHAGNITTIQLLLESGYSIDSTDSSGKTALRHAVDLNAQDTINFLLRSKANPNKPDYMGNTPAHSAAANNNIETLSALKSYNANMNVQNKNGETIAHTAAHNGSAAVMRYLLENHNRLIRTANNEGNVPLHTAIDSRKITIARILLAQNDPSINAYNNAGNTPLHSAVESKQLDFVNLLCSHHADFRYNRKGYSQLHTAAAIGFMDGIKTLKEYSARITDVTGDNNSPLHIAFINNHFNCTHLLIDRTVAFLKNNKGRTPLHIIASKKNADTAIIDLLMNYPLDINSPDKKGYTPFAHAARKGNLAMMKKLRYYNAAIFTRDKQNNTYLHLAAKNGDLQTVEYLKSMGLSLRDKNNNNETPFIAAAAGGKSNIINALCIEDFFKDGSMAMGVRKARINGHYSMASDLERKIEQRRKDCEALKALQTEVERLVNTNINNSIALTQKTLYNYKEFAYNYTPTPCVYNQLALMTTNDISEKSTAEQRDILKQQLIARQRQEEQHKRILEQRILSVRQSEERKLYADAVKREQERKDLLNKCEQILTIQKAIASLMETNKKIDAELKEINQKAPLAGYQPYAPSSCAQQPSMNLEQLLRLEAEKRALLLKKMLTDQNYESQKKTYLEQQKLKAASNVPQSSSVKISADVQPKVDAPSNEQIAAECCVCLEETVDAKAIPCTSCNKGSSRICSTCLASVMAGNKRCPICNLNTLQVQPKLNQPQMPSPLRAGR